MTTKTGNMERRNVPRVAPEGVINVNLLSPGRLETGTLVDLNNAGAFVATDLVLEKGDSVSIELKIPGVDCPTPLKAVVARCSDEIKGRSRTIPAGLGVVFIGNTPEERQLIQQVVMSTLTLDLLSFGCDQRVRARKTAETLPFSPKGA